MGSRFGRFLLATKDVVGGDSVPPQLIAQVVAVDARRAGQLQLTLRLFTGEETPWQAPGERTLRVRPPQGVRPRVGQALLLQVRGHNDNRPPDVLWDAPEPQLPPMRFPDVVDGDDPEVMRRHLDAMLASGALPADAHTRALEYLARGGWPVPAEPGA